MKRALAPAYDLFKLVVALVLAAILFILMMRGCSTAPAPLLTATAAASPSPLPPTNIPAPTLEPPVDTPAPLLPADTATPEPISLPTETPNPTEILPTATPEPTPTPMPTPEPTPAPAPTPEPAPANPDCPGAATSRLKVGDRVRVLQNLNMRLNPGLNGAWILTNATGTELEIIGGPACTAVGKEAYEWWQVRRADGKEGWSAEGSLTGRFYFLEPIK